MTSGRHRATVSATAREPSACLSMSQLHEVGGPRGRDIGLAERAGEALANRGGQRPERERAGDRGEPAQQRRARQRAPEVLARQLGGRQGDEREAVDDVLEAQLRDAAAGVDEYVRALAHAAEDVDLVQQGGVLHDQRVGLRDRLAGADRTVVDAAERDHRRAGALGAEARERLRVAALQEGCGRQQLGGGDDPLPATAVDADLKHRADQARPWGTGAVGSRPPVAAGYGTGDVAAMVPASASPTQAGHSVVSTWTRIIDVAASTRALPARTSTSVKSSGP